MNLSLKPSILLASLFLAVPGLVAQTPAYNPGKAWGTVAITALKEASGLSASWRNPGVLWTHNDGSKKKIYGITPAGLHAATFEIAETVGDVEEIAVGPGPVQDVSYLYIGDIGGNSSPGDIRGSVRILRVPEPSMEVSSTTVASPPSTGAGTASVFTLLYPDQSSDAEAMIVDPVNADLYVFSKTSGASRVYRTNLNSLAPGSTSTLTLLTTVPVSEPSAADISRDGSRIVLRNETGAWMWPRPVGSTVSAALAGIPRSVPVIGTPLEPNGEAIAFLTDGSGYMTISEGTNPVLYYFQAQLPMAPAVQSPILPHAVFTGAHVQLRAVVSGFPQPAFTWRFEGTILPGQTSDTLALTNVMPAQSGVYEITATNAQGTATARATLTVRSRPLVRITEVQAQAASSSGADWWELTSFESEPVDLSGWRFNDDGGDLDNAFVFPQGLTIAPGESIIFVESLTPAQFRWWWGSGVPADAQIVTYTGGGLALGNTGDTVRVWNDTSTSVTDTIATQTFGEAGAGVSLAWDPVAGAFGAQSQIGINGAFRSDSATDTGSPGLWLAPAAPPALTLTKLTDTLRLEFQTSPHHWYTLETSDDLSPDSWTSLTPFQAIAAGARSVELPISGSAEFYRLRIR